MGLAILASPEIYNFSELLEQPLLKNLESSQFQWVYQLLNIFNKGDIATYNQVIKDAAERDVLSMWFRIKLEPIWHRWTRKLDSWLCWSWLSICPKMTELSVSRNSQTPVLFPSRMWSSWSWKQPHLNSCKLTSTKLLRRCSSSGLHPRSSAMTVSRSCWASSPNGNQAPRRLRTSFRITGKLLHDCITVYILNLQFTTSSLIYLFIHIVLSERSKMFLWVWWIGYKNWK